MTWNIFRFGAVNCFGRRFIVVSVLDDSISKQEILSFKKLLIEVDNKEFSLKLPPMKLDRYNLILQRPQIQTFFPAANGNYLNTFNSITIPQVLVACMSVSSSRLCY